MSRRVGDGTGDRQQAQRTGSVAADAVQTQLGEAEGPVGARDADKASVASWLGHSPT